MASRWESETNYGDGPGGGGVAIGVLVVVVAIVGLFMAINWLTAFKSVGPSDVCVVQEGGPFDGRSVKEVRQPASGVSNIGIYNDQRCLPATDRFYTISADPEESDRGKTDFVQVPTLDAQDVRIEGQALFRLNTDPSAIRSFYKKFGVRTFNGKHPYDGDGGWENFLGAIVKPVLDNAIREAIGGFNCTDLRNTCQYVTNANEVAQGNVVNVNNKQKIAQAQTAIEEALQADLNSTLSGCPQPTVANPKPKCPNAYFESIRFRLRAIQLPDQVEKQVEQAQAQKVSVARARLRQQALLETARGQRAVAREQNAALREKAKGYKENPAQAEIDKIKAFCGESGCDPQAVGGDFLNQLSK